jgi:2-keto-4-pentenoate hydratase
MIARQLVAARAEDRVLETYPGPLPDTLSDAYAIQDDAIALHGVPVAGWKVGRITGEYVGALRAARLVGPIFADQIVGPDASKIVEVPILRGFAAVEAELLLRIGATVPSNVAIDDVPRYVAEARFGIEIASSPLPFINERGPAVTASDFGNNFGLILGPQLADWCDGAVFDLSASMTIDGTLTGEGCPADILDGPFGAVAFLAQLMEQRGRSLDAGTWVSTGAITGVHQVRPGQNVEATFADKWTVGCRVAASAPASKQNGAAT